MTNGHNDSKLPDPNPENVQPETAPNPGPDAAPVAGPEAGSDTGSDIIVDFDSLPADKQVAILRQDLNEARDELGQTREQVQRAQADLANFRRRTEEEQSAVRQDANRRLIMNLLPVIDELELAINHLGDPGNGEAGSSWVEGVKLIHRKAYGVLEAEGLSRIESVGLQFDPLQHEAVGVVESAEHPSGYVVEALRNGYRLRDRVIQAAQVVVAR